jgi:hypothetical protein
MIYIYRETHPLTGLLVVGSVGVGPARVVQLYTFIYMYKYTFIYMYIYVNDCMHAGSVGVGPATHGAVTRTRARARGLWCVHHPGHTHGHTPGCVADVRDTPLPLSLSPSLTSVTRQRPS